MNNAPPAWLKIVHSENAIFADKRTGQSSANRWSEYGNAAQVVLAYMQDFEEVDIREIIDSEGAVAFIAAARILDSLSALPAEGTDSDTRISYVALTATAYATLGNFPAARTVLRDHAEEIAKEKPLLSMLLSCSAPSLLDKLIPDDSPGQILAFRDLLSGYLISGSDEAWGSIVASFDALLPLVQQESFETAIWASSRVVLKQLSQLGAARLLNSVIVDKVYLDKLLSSGLSTLLPTQFLALTGTKLITSQSNSVISLPTSTGKTVLSEITIFTNVREGNIGIFVVPYVALGRQVSQRISDHLPDHWRMWKMFGGYSEEVEYHESGKRTFIVATPERLDSLMRSRPQILDRVDCIVFDEAHIVESGERGLRIESLIARLMLRQSQGNNMRIVLMSAVVPNLDALMRWTQTPRENVVRSSWVPSCRRIALWSRVGKILWYNGHDPLLPDDADPMVPIAITKLPWPNTMNPSGNVFAATKHFAVPNNENIAFLLSYLWTEHEEPVLCVCPTKEQTRLIAAALRKRFAVLAELPKHIARAIQLIADKYPYYTHLAKALQCGVAFHNAGLPHDLRAAIEDAATEKELRVVTATTTLAEGVDLPFRVTVLSDWLAFRDEGQVPYTPLLVRNIAGRCGRAGSFTEGDVIVYDSPLGDPSYKKGPGRVAGLKRILFSEGDVGVQSTLSMSSSESIWATLSSQFLAAVVENPDTENIEAVFASKLLSNASDDGNLIQNRIANIAENLESADWCLASRNSPLTITELGKAVSCSGFSPESSKRIGEALMHIPTGNSEAKLANYLLTTLGDLPEQPNAKFRKLVAHWKASDAGDAEGKKGPRLPIRQDELPAILEGWIAGVEPMPLFEHLPSVTRSKRNPSFQEWRAGLDQPTSWDDEFDKFCDFLGSVVFEFVPWILRACSLIQPHVLPTLTLNWTEMSEKFRRDNQIVQRPQLELIND